MVSQTFLVRLTTYGKVRTVSAQTDDSRNSKIPKARARNRFHEADSPWFWNAIHPSGPVPKFPPPLDRNKKERAYLWLRTCVSLRRLFASIFSNDLTSGRNGSEHFHEYIVSTHSHSKLPIRCPLVRDSEYSTFELCIHN